MSAKDYFYLATRHLPLRRSALLVARIIKLETNPSLQQTVLNAARCEISNHQSRRFILDSILQFTITCATPSKKPLSDSKKIMFRIIVGVAILLPLLVACKKDQSISFEPGVYKGSFRRSGQGYSGTSKAEVELIFDGNTFWGSSTLPFYPAIGEGSYSLLHDKIVFRNESVFPANFDWSLILDDSFSTNIQGDSVVLIKGYSNASLYHDVYTLKKQ